MVQVRILWKEKTKKIIFFIDFFYSLIYFPFLLLLYLSLISLSTIFSHISMANHHITVSLDRFLWNGFAGLSVCVLSHAYSMTLMSKHRCTVSLRLSLFIFVINNNSPWAGSFVFFSNAQYVNLPRSRFTIETKAHDKTGIQIDMCFSWHILSVNAQTYLSMHAVSPEPLLLARALNGCR